MSLIDRRKPSFRKLGVGNRDLSAEEAIELMQREPSIIKRPSYEIDGGIVIGVDQETLDRLLA